MSNTSPVLGTANLAFVESLYSRYLEDPNSVPEDFRRYFEAEHPASGNVRIGPSFAAHSLFDPTGSASIHVSVPRGPSPSNGANGASSNGGAVHEASGSAARSDAARSRNVPARNGAHSYGAPSSASSNGSNGHTALARAVSEPSVSAQPVQLVVESPGTSDVAAQQDRVDQLVRAYRVRGHMIAKVDPLGLARPHYEELDPEYYGLGPADMDRVFSSRTITGTQRLTLSAIVERLRNTYCRSIGVEFMHIHDPTSKNWLQERMEGSENRIELDLDTQRYILTLLTDAVMLEEFIQRKYVRAKSFSLEGSESLLPLLHLAIDRAAEHGVDEVTLGMAHRGRLNVLANLMGKSPREIFREFDDVDPELYRGRGDVKYHLGRSHDFTTLHGRKVHLSLCFNPSHLEFVNGVVLGRVRAKQDRAGDLKRVRKMGLVIHGDAAFIGEGIVQECLNMSGLEPYETGGTVHVVINNQIGFTTPAREARSTTYCTDIAKMLQSPIFHVNGEDPEAVAQVVTLAMDFRSTFSRDVVIDMYGYRRHGHNEGDEPSFTQPVLYRAISKRPSVRDGYLENLTREGDITREEADAIAVRRREHLELELSEARSKDFQRRMDWLGGYWKGYQGGPESEIEDVDTSVEPAVLRDLLLRQTRLPEDFQANPKVAGVIERRAEMARGERPLDWGAAEACAFASVLNQGVPVRLTGQDVARGTFAHRHAVLHDVRDGRTYTPLAHLAVDGQPRVQIYNSPLSEQGVMSFEWGYSLDSPEGLVMWEAQFGDFVNCAQVIIDQFLVSAEDKWKRLSGLVLLLPHGFEGQGPEHSSARLERFLMLAAEDNIQIAQLTTPAQYYHLLRRQVLRPWRKPLIVFTPKSLLRHPDATSDIEEMARGSFHRVLPDPDGFVGPGVQRVLLCSGKVYYELLAHRRELGRKDVAIVRLEQIYPFPRQALASILESYSAGTRIVWVQEEPENMGAWPFLRLRFGERLFGRHPLSGASRDESASPATGSASSHRLEQQELIGRAFAPF
ncbi:MAG TPA: 2-oxoglutarate dehydrogenase E1 component [Polyangiaceae bacterium]|nr:2-oxoglutarate dehydrogenase E1 component [Polyangiaceae bacterium]